MFKKLQVLLYIQGFDEERNWMVAIKIQKRKKETNKLINRVPGKSDKPWKTIYLCCGSSV